MPNTDFFDEDLTGTNRGRDPRPAGSGESLKEDLAGADAPPRPATDPKLTGVVRQKEEVERQVATASHEIDRLRKRQEDLERERHELEDLRRKQDDYDRGRREIGDRLGQSLIMMEKEEIKAEKLTELLRSTRASFQTLLSEVRGIDDERWEEANLREELNKALVILDGARMEYNKGLARVEVAMNETSTVSDATQPLLPGGDAKRDPSFGLLLKAGFAFSLPLVLTALAVAAAFIGLRVLDLI